MGFDAAEVSGCFGIADVSVVSEVFDVLRIRAFYVVFERVSFLFQGSWLFCCA